MKKTMFITSVIMVVVLAIALTTSSLAWFTAGGATSVGTNTLNLSAVSAEAAGAGLEITKDTTGDWFTSNVNLANADALRPMCPVGYTTKSAISSSEFYAAVNAMQERKVTNRDGVPYFSAEGADASSDPYMDTLYIRNSGASACNVNATITIAIDTAAASGSSANLWVAVFDVTTANAPVLMALSCSGAADATLTYAQAATDLAVDAPAGGITGANGVVRANINSIAGEGNSANRTITLAGGTDAVNSYIPGAAHTIEVYAWYDGNSLTTQNRDTVVTISVRFAIASGSGS